MVPQAVDTSMKDFPVRNIFLPAALAASAVFSAFTLPTALKQSINHAVDLPLLDQQSQMRLDRVHKDIAIPYIGTVIVLSAGSGIATAELIRKWRSARQAAAQKVTLASAETDVSSDVVAEVDSQPTTLPLTDLDLVWPTSDSPEATAPIDKTALTYDFPGHLAEAAWPKEIASKTPTSGPESAADYTVVIFPGQYQRCRIQVPHLQEQLYAIEFDGRFYSLLSAGVSKEQAVAAITQLNQAERPAILTQMNQGYAVWVLEPQAQLVSVA